MPQATKYLKTAEHLIPATEDVAKRTLRELCKAYSRADDKAKVNEYLGKLHIQHYSTVQDFDELCVLGNHYLRNQSHRADLLEDAKGCFNKALKVATLEKGNEKLAIAYHYLGTTVKKMAKRHKIITKNTSRSLLIESLRNDDDDNDDDNPNAAEPQGKKPKTAQSAEPRNDTQQAPTLPTHR